MASKEERATYKAIADFAAFFKELDRAEAALAKFRAQAGKDIKVNVEVDVDDKAFKEKVQAAAKSVKPGDIKVGLDVDRKAFSERVGAAVKAVKPDAIRVGLDVDRAAFSERVGAAVKAVRPDAIKVGLDVDRTAFSERVGAAVKAVRPDAIKVGLDVDRGAFSQRVSAAVAAVRPDAIKVGLDVDRATFNQRVQAAVASVRADDVKVKLDVDQAGFSQRVRAAVAAVRTDDVKVKLDVDQAGFSQRVRAAVASVRAQDIKIKLDVDQAGFAQRVRAAVAAVRTQDIKIKLDVDAAGLRSRVQAAVAAARGIDVTVGVNLDTGHLRAELQAALLAASAGLRIDIPVHVDSTGLREEIRRAIAAASAGQRVNIPMGGSGGLGGGGGLGGLGGGAGGLGGAAASAAATTAAYSALGVAITGLIGAATALVGALAPVVALMGSALPGAALGFGTALGSLAAAFMGPLSALKALSAAEKESGTAAASGAKQAQSAANQRANAAAGVASAQEGLSRAYENAAEAQAQAARRVADAEAGVTDARQKAAEANQAAAARVVAAQQNQVKVAQDSAEANVQAARRVQDAQSSLADAFRAAAEANAAAARRVQDAQESLAQTYQDVAQRNADAQQQTYQAEANMVRTQQDARRAQEDLNQARRDAVSDLDDMRRALRQTALDEREDTLAVEEARVNLNKTLSDPQATKLERERAQLSYDRAVANLDDLKKRQEQQRTEYVKTSQAGVDGTARVKTAQDKLNSAVQTQMDAEVRWQEASRQQARTAVDGQRSIQKAQRDVADAQAAAAKTAVDGQRNIAKAQRDVADAQLAQQKTARDGQQAVAQAAQEVAAAQKEQTKTAIEGQKAVIKAQRDVADALQAQRKTARDSARSIEDAQRALASAQRQMAQAMQDQMSGTQTAADKAAAALAKLTPEARAVVQALWALKPAWESIQKTAQRQMMPGVLDLINSLKTTLPNLEKIVGATSRVMGNLASEFGRMFASPAWQKDLVNIGESNARVLQNLGDAALSVLDIFRNLTAVAQPFIEGWSGAVKRTLEMWDAQVKTARSTGALNDLFEKAKVIGQELGRILGNTWRGFWAVLKAGYPYGKQILDLIEGWSKKFELWAKSAKGQKEINQFFKGSVLIFQLLAGAIGVVAGWLLYAVKRLGDLSDWDKANGGHLRQLFLDIGAAAQWLGKMIIDHVISGLEAIATWYGKHRDELVPLFQRLGEKLSWCADNVGLLIAAFVGFKALGFLKGILGWVGGLVQSLGPAGLGGISGSAVASTALIAGGLILLGIALYQAYQKSEGFRNAVKGLWEELKNWFVDIIQPAFKGLVDFFNTYVVPIVERVVRPAVEGLTDALRWMRQAIDDIKGPLKTFFEALKPVADILRDDIAPLVGGGLKIAFQTLGVIVAGVVYVFGGLVTVLSKLGLLKPILLGLAAAFFPLIGIIAAIKGLIWVFERLPGAISAVIGWFEKLPGYISTAASAIGDFFTKLPGRIWGFVKDAGKWLVDTGKKLWGSWDDYTGFTGGIHTAWDAMVNFFTGLPDKIKEFFKDATRWLVDKGKDIIGQWDNYTGFIGGIHTGWDAVVDFFTKLPERISRLLGQALGWSFRAPFELGNLIIHGIWLGMQAAWNGIVLFFQNLPTWLGEFFTTAGSWLLSAGDAIVHGLWLGIQGAWNGIVLFFQNLPGWLGSFFTNAPGWLLTAGDTIIHGLWLGIQGAWDGVLTFFTDILPTALKAVFVDAPLWLLQTGMDIIGGLLKGIGNAIVGIATWVWDNVIWPLIDGFLSALGIKSPSTVFMEFGKDVLRGFLNGIKAIAEVIGAVAKWVWDNIGWPIVSGFVTAGTWLYNAGKAVLGGLFNGAKAIGEVIGAVGKWVWDNIGWPFVSGIGNVAVWLFNAGKAILGGLFNGIKNLVSVYANAATWLWNNVGWPFVSGIGNVASWLFNAGKAVLGGLFNGIKNIASVFVNAGVWLWDNVGSPFISGLGNLATTLGSWLIEGGKAVLGGLFNGIKDIGSAVAGGIAALGKWVWDNIGDPIVKAFGGAKDWLLDVGRAIIGGLFRGMAEGGKAGSGAGPGVGAPGDITIPMPGTGVPFHIPNPFDWKTGGLIRAQTGGWFRGPGTGTSDSILARVSNGEFVVNAERARHYRYLLEALNHGAKQKALAQILLATPAGAEGGLVGHGLIGYAAGGSAPTARGTTGRAPTGKATLTVTLDTATPDSRALISGFVAGLAKAVAESAADVKRNVTDRIISMLRDPFGIASPSKLTQGYGRSLVDGLTVGMTQQAPAIATATGKLVGQVQGIATGTTATVRTVGQQVGVYAGHVTGMAVATEGATGRVTKAHGVQGVAVAQLARVQGQQTGAINTASAGMAGATEGATGRVTKAHGVQSGAVTLLARTHGAQTGAINTSNAAMAGFTEGATGRVVKSHGVQQGSQTATALLVGVRHGQINASSAGMATATEGATKRVGAAQDTHGKSTTGLTLLVGTRHGQINASSAGMATATEGATKRVQASHGAQQGSQTATALLVGTRHAQINTSSGQMATSTEGATTRVNAAYTGMQQKVDSLHGKTIEVIGNARVNLPNAGVLANAVKTAVNTITSAGGGGAGVLVAQGAIFQRAEGGIDHIQPGVAPLPDQAIISPARGPGLVQWAEAETGGEAFIPLAPGKRARSTRIWEETGRRLGALESRRTFFEGGLLGVNTTLNQGNFNDVVTVQVDTDKTATDLARPVADKLQTTAMQLLTDTITMVAASALAPKGPGFSMSGNWAPSIRPWVEYIARSLNISAMSYAGHHPAENAAADLALSQDGMKNTAPKTGPSGPDLYSRVADWVDKNIISKPTPGWYVGVHAGIKSRGGPWRPILSQQGRRGQTFAHDDHVHVSFDPRGIGPLIGVPGNYSAPNFNWDHGGAAPKAVAVPGFFTAASTTLGPLGPAGSHWSQAQMEMALRAAGFDPSTAHIFSAIGMGETGGWNFPTSNPTGRYHGPWAFQEAWAIPAGLDMHRLDTDLAYAAQQVKILFDRAGWQPWWGDAPISGPGNYSRFLAEGGRVSWLARGGFPKFPEPRGTDTVPAMLTPGEYVINRESVEAVGLPFLEHLNGVRRGAGNLRQRYAREPDSTWASGERRHYAAGGIVANPHNAAEWKIADAQARFFGQLQANITRGRYGSRFPEWTFLLLVAWNQARDAMARLTAGYLADRKITPAEDKSLWGQLNKLKDLVGQMKAGPPPSVTKWQDEANRTKSATNSAMATYGAAMKRGDLTAVPNAKKDIDALKGAVDSVNKQVALVTLDKIVTSKEHKDLDAARSSLSGKQKTVQDWINMGPMLDQVKAQQTANLRAKQFQDWVLQVATWGYSLVANKLSTGGVEGEGNYDAAKAFASNKAAAAQMETQLKAAQSILSGEDLTLAANLLSVLAATPNLGLRDAADAIEKIKNPQAAVGSGAQSMANLVAIVPRLTSQLAKVGTKGTAKFLADVKAWNAGVPFGGGGLVTPGLFMARGGLVPELGFANGGAVELLTPGGFSSSSVVTTVGGRTAPNVGTIVIHNPVAQASEESLRRTVSKLQFLGAFK